MANTASFIGRTRTHVGRLIESYQDVTGDLNEYTALGGRDAIHAYFVTVDPVTKAETPRTDIDITEQQFVDAVASLATIGALILQGHNTNLHRVRA